MGLKVSGCLKCLCIVKAPSEGEDLYFPSTGVQKFSNSSSTGSLFINSLPPEMIIEISSYLEGEDLESLSMTCKNFLTIIRNCKKLSYKLPLKFIQNFDIPNEIDIKKYRHIEILDGGIVNYLAELRNLSTNIKSLSIQCKEVKLWSLKCILSTCKCLKHLKLDIKNLMIYEIVRSTDSSSESSIDSINDLRLIDPYSIYFFDDQVCKLKIEIKKFTFSGHFTSTEMVLNYPQRYLMLYTKDMTDEDEARRALIKRMYSEFALFRGPDMSGVIQKERHIQNQKRIKQLRWININ